MSREIRTRMPARFTPFGAVASPCPRRWRRALWATTLSLGLAGSGVAQTAETPSPRLERRVLQALSPPQAEAFAHDADPAEIVLEDGETLAQLLARAKAEAGVELAFTPLDPCVLVRTAGSTAGALAAGETRAFRARGSLSAQGGAVAGCGIPADAQALAAIVRVAASRGKGSLRVWPSGDPEPGISLLDYGATGGPVTSALLELCHAGSCAADFQAHAVGAGTHVRVDVVGYFAPLDVTQGPAGDPGPPGSPGAPGPPGPPGLDGAAGTSCTVASSDGNATLSCTDGSAVSWFVGFPPSLDAGLAHTCGVMHNRSIVCWGSNAAGQSSPIPAGSYIQVSAGSVHTCGLQTNGSVACWGSNGAGQVSPIPPGTYSQVSAGETHTCAVGSGGSVVCWGNNGVGQVSPIPPGTYAEVSAGGSHSCGLRTDGSIACWGANFNGQVSPIPPGTYVQVAAGANHTCGRAADGSINCWGLNSFGQVSPVPPGMYAQVAPGGFHTCGVQTSGSVACWGDNGGGQVSPVPIATYTQVSAGDSHSCGLTTSGQSLCWGLDSSGQASPPPFFP